MGSGLVIGGGAAGLAAAIAAAECGDTVTVAEKMDRVGKKILATGNGRCNLMNTGAPRYPGNAAFAADVLSHCGAEAQKAFWEHLGLRLRQEEAGRVYPVSSQASSVLDALRLQLTALHVRVVTGVSITALQRENDGWTALSADGQRFWANRVIISGGGCAQPKLGSDGSALRLLTNLGCPATPFAPALTQIITDSTSIKGLSGIRVKAQVAVIDRKSVLHEEDGELLFADYGVSGVCVMQCARYAKDGRVLRVSLVKGMGFADAGEFRRELNHRRKNCDGGDADRVVRAAAGGGADVAGRLGSARKQPVRADDSGHGGAPDENGGWVAAADSRREGLRERTGCIGRGGGRGF